MINTDEDALICDLAETYQIFDYKSLPCKKVAIFSCGLRENSRIKMKLSGTKISTQEMLLAAIADNTKLLAWLQSKDGADGINRPKSVLLQLMNSCDGDDEVVSFESGEDFEAEWKRRAGEEV